MSRNENQNTSFTDWYDSMLFDFSEDQWGDFSKIKTIQKERSNLSSCETIKKNILDSLDIILDSELSLPFREIVKKEHEDDSRVQMFINRFKLLQIKIAIYSKTPELYQKYLKGDNIKASYLALIFDNVNMVIFSPEMKIKSDEIIKILNNKSSVTFFGSPYNDEFWENLEIVLTKNSCEISVSFYYEFFPSPCVFGFSLYPSLQRPKPSSDDILLQRELLRKGFETIFTCQKPFNSLTPNEQRWAVYETKISLVDSGF